MNTKQLGFEIR